MQNQDTCPSGAKGRGTIPKALTKALQLAKAGKLQGDSGPLTPTDVAVTVHDLLYGQSHYEMADEVIPRLASGAQPDGGIDDPSEPPSQSDLWIIPLVCMDDRPDDNSFAGWSKLRNAALKVRQSSVPAYLGSLDSATD